MKVAEAVRLVIAGQLPLPVLWAIATDPERIQAALILGRPQELPRRARTPAAAWAALNEQQRSLVARLAPVAISECLSDAAAAPPARPAPRAARARAG